MTEIFVISDLHLGHKNVLNFEPRYFNSLEEREELIFTNWNNVVGKNDIVYILGDLTLHSYSENKLKQILNNLNGIKILIRGNHDHLTRAKYLQMGFKEVHNGPLYIEGGKIILSHEPVKEAKNNPYVINLHGHTHQKILDLSNFYNICTCNINYTPVNIKQYIKRTFDLKPRKEKFGEEWYFKYFKED